jgi:hypothetical protein
MALIKMVRNEPRVPGGSTEGMFDEALAADLKKLGWKPADKGAEKAEPKKEEPKSELKEPKVEPKVEQKAEEPKAPKFEEKKEFKDSKK